MTNDLDNRVEAFLCDYLEEIEGLSGNDKHKAMKHFNDIYGNWNRSYEINRNAMEKQERLEFDKKRADEDRKVKALEGQVEFEKIRFERERTKKQRRVDVLKCAVPVAQTGIACLHAMFMIASERAILEEGHILPNFIKNFVAKPKFF